SIKDELVEFIKEQIKIEREIVDSLNKGLSDVMNPAVKGSLKSISLDSVKHAEMYDAAVKLLTSVPQAVTQAQLDRQKDLVEKHIRIEARLIKRISDTIPNVKNDKVRLLLNAILEDEKRHHGLLKQVLNILVQGETITENEWWDIMWKNVPTHGSPGG
ncbi:MAG: ferritin-like domain-containing protein, partial [Candidatus Bathyarchaeia archaeon]